MNIQLLTLIKASGNVPIARNARNRVSALCGRIASCCTVVLTLTIFALLYGSASAVTLFNSGGFEPPDYSTTYNPGAGYNGQLEGQPPAAPSLFFRQSGPDINTAKVVANTVGGTGLQVVRLDRTNTPDTRWGVPLTGYPLSTADTISISWDMRVEQAAGPSGTFGPYFGIEAYANPAGGNTLLGSLGVDATTHDLLYQAAGTGDLTETGILVAPGQWNHYGINLNYATHQYSIYFNNTQVGSPVGFVDGPFNAFSDADLAGLIAAGNSAAVPGTAFYDNYLITEVPEPTAIALCSMALFVAGARRRARARWRSL